VTEARVVTRRQEAGDCGVCEVGLGGVVMVMRERLTVDGTGHLYIHNRAATCRADSQEYLGLC